MDSLSADGLGRLDIRQEIEIAAPRRAVFAALTDDVSAWWGRPYTLDGDRARALVLEPRVGGLFLEQWGDDEGAIWCTVTAFARDRLVELQGPMGMSGAVLGRVRFELSDGPGGDASTLLKLDHRAIGELDPAAGASYDAGWRDLLDHRLRAWVEAGERRGLGHEPPLDRQAGATEQRP
jgi:uncharacterized protein YndB with AHSA1/START domain